jgi:CheY-like chemotaxis protein
VHLGQGSTLQGGRSPRSVTRGALLANAPAIRRPRALLVDDDPVVLQILSALLDELGIDCLHAADGRQGLRRISEELLSLDLLVTDLIMPDLTGDALVLAVRELGGERDLPIVVASAYVAPEQVDALRIAGADAVVDTSEGLAPVAVAARELLLARGHLRPRAPAAERAPVPVGRIGLTRARQ